MTSLPHTGTGAGFRRNFRRENRESFHVVEQQSEWWSFCHRWSREMADLQYAAVCEACSWSCMGMTCDRRCRQSASWPSGSHRHGT